MEGDCICHNFSRDMVLWTVRETIKFTQNAVSEPESNTHGPEDRVTTNFLECNAIALEQDATECIGTCQKSVLGYSHMLAQRPSRKC
jgi:hypothetical protein